MKYEFLLFDLDGTLVETFTNFVRMKKRIYEVIAPYQASLTLDTKLSTTYYVEIAKNINPEIYQHCMSIIAEEEEKGMINAQIFSDTLPLLSQCNLRGIKLGILTNNSKHNLDYLLKRFNLEQYFPNPNYLLTREDVNVMKPDPGGLLLFIKRSQRSKDDTLFIGDAGIDAQAAAAAKMHFALIDRLHKVPENIPRTYSILQLTELLNIFH